MENKIFIHIHIPKNAGTFIKMLSDNSPESRIFYPYLNQSTKDPYGWGKTFSIVMKQHYNVSFLERNIPSIKSPKVQLFSVVRNPYDRIYSLWKFCRRDGVAGSVNLPAVPDKFEDFIYDLCDDEYLGQYMMQSQLFYIKGIEKYNGRVFKLEQQEILQRFLVDECKTSWNTKKVNDTPGPDYRKVYTPELAMLVKNKFIKEFETLNYSTDLI